MRGSRFNTKDGWKFDCAQFLFVIVFILDMVSTCPKGCGQERPDAACDKHLKLKAIRLGSC